MAEPLLDRIHSEIRARVRELRPAVVEYEQLQAADAALAGLVTAQPSAGRADAARSTGAAAPRPSSRPRRSTGERAPRSANRAAILRVLEERPGVSAADLTSASGVDRTVLHDLLRALEQRGEVAEDQLPGGETGYRLASPAPPEPTSATSKTPPIPTELSPSTAHRDRRRLAQPVPASVVVDRAYGPASALQLAMPVASFDRPAPLRRHERAPVIAIHPCAGPRERV